MPQPGFGVEMVEDLDRGDLATVDIWIEGQLHGGPRQESLAHQHAVKQEVAREEPMGRDYSLWESPVRDLSSAASR